jgi:predicted transcriptional regulator
MKSETATSAEIVPPDLAAEIEAIAAEEHRAPGELVRDALERYKSDRDWQRLHAYGAARAKELGLTEEDVPRLIAESRREQRQKQPPGR